MKNRPQTARALLSAALRVLALIATAAAPASRALSQTQRQVADKLHIRVEQVERLNTERALRNEVLDKLPPQALPKLIQRLDYADLVRERIAFRLLQERDENGDIPPDALPTAIEQMDSLRARSQKVKVAGVPVAAVHAPLSGARLLPPPPVGGLATKKWSAIGPGNVGGRVRSIIIHPTNPNVIWVGSVGGGIWRTDDGGNSFAPVDDLMANLAVCCMVMDPTDARVIYAGTGEGFSNVDAIRGGGIFRTQDGTRWERLPATDDERFHYVTQLAVAPDGVALLAATPSGLLRSQDKEKRLEWNPPTLVAGETQVPFTVGLGDVDFHPSEASKAVAGGLDGDAFFSTDGGATWRRAAHPGTWGGRIELTYARANPEVVYASVDVNRGEIWKSVDGGQNYSKMGSKLADGRRANYLGGQGWYDNVIWAGDPTDANFVLVGGIDLWKSGDGGNTLVDVSTWSDPRSAHADQHVIVSHPRFNGTTNKAVYFGNDGGLYRTDDVRRVGGDPEPPRIQGWIRLVNTLAVTQFYGGAGHPSTGVIIGGAQDNGTLRYTTAGGPERWTEIFGGDGGACASDPTDPNVFYGEYVYLNIHRNTDGGATPDTQGDRYISGQFFNFVTREWDWKPYPYHIPDAKNRRALFIAPFVLDPNQPDRILAGGVSLWRTADAKTPNTDNCDPDAPPCGPSWAMIKPSVHFRISAVAVARGDSNVIWVGHENGEVYKTSNGLEAAPIWQRADENGPSHLPDRYVTRITVDPTNPNVVYATFGGYTPGNVWKTTDGGLKWANLGGSLPHAPVRSLIVHPRNSNFLYIGTEVGVFASEDGGASWSPTNEGPTSCSVDDLFWMGETLVAVTHGRGMFIINLSLQS